MAVTAKLTKDAAIRDELKNRKGKTGIEDVGMGIKHKFTQLAQLLMQERKAATLGAYVDEATVRAIRQGLRRKYAARSNLDRIWSQWCKDGSGLSVEDLFLGMNKCGVTVSLD